MSKKKPIDLLQCTPKVAIGNPLRETDDTLGVCFLRKKKKPNESYTKEIRQEAYVTRKR